MSNVHKNNVNTQAHNNLTTLVEFKYPYKEMQTNYNENQNAHQSEQLNQLGVHNPTQKLFNQNRISNYDVSFPE